MMNPAKSPAGAYGLTPGVVTPLSKLPGADFFAGKKRKFNESPVNKTALTFYLLKLDDVLLFISAAGATYKAALEMDKKWSELKFRGHYVPADLPRRFVNDISVPVNDTYCNAGFFQLACDVSDISNNGNLLREMEAK